MKKILLNIKLKKKITKKHKNEINNYRFNEKIENFDNMLKMNKIIFIIFIIIITIFKGF